jgi:hypothetical protein
MKKVLTSILFAFIGLGFAQDKTGWPEILRFGLLPREESTVDDQYGLFLSTFQVNLAFRSSIFLVAITPPLSLP